MADFDFGAWFSFMEFVAIGLAVVAPLVALVLLPLSSSGR